MKISLNTHFLNLGNLEIQATRDETTLNVVKEPLWIEKSIDGCVPLLEHSIVCKSNFLEFSDLLFDDLGFLRTLYKEEKIHGVIKCLERLHKNYYYKFCDEDKKKKGVYEPSVVNLCFSCTVYQLIQNEWVKAWKFYELDKKQTKAVLSLSSVEALEKYCMKLIYRLTSNYHEVKRIDLKLCLTHTGNVTYFKDFKPLDSDVFYIDVQKLVLNLFQVWGSLSYQEILRGLKISDKPQAVCSEIQTLEKTGIIKRTAGLKIKDGRWKLGEISHIDNLPMYKKVQVQILDQNRIRATQLRARELTGR